MRVQAGEWHWNKPSEADSNCHVRCQPCRGPRKDRPTKRITRNSWHVVVVLVSPGYLQAARYEELTHRGRPAVFFSTLLHDPAFRMKLCQALGAKNFTYENQFIASAYICICVATAHVCRLNSRHIHHHTSPYPAAACDHQVRLSELHWLHVSTLACRESPLPIPIIYSVVLLFCFSFICNFLFTICNDVTMLCRIGPHKCFDSSPRRWVHLVRHWWKPKKHRHVSFLGKRIYMALARSLEGSFSSPAVIIITKTCDRKFMNRSNTTEIVGSYLLKNRYSNWNG